MARTVFITGANSGIGFATTKLFMQNGWNVVGTARNPAEATGLAELAHSNPNQLLVVALDVLLSQTYQPALDAAVAKFANVDVLINNAGYGQLGLLEHLTMEDYRRQFDVNFFGPVALTKLFIPHFRTVDHSGAHPTIIYVSSGAAHFGLPLSSPYTASKSALDRFAESVSFELAQLDPPVDVKVIPIHGGVKSTNFLETANIWGAFANKEEGSGEQKREIKDAKDHYGVFTEKVLATFEKMSGRSMEVEDAAWTIYTAATDGERKLRYFVGGKEGGTLLQERMRSGKEDDSLDEMDDRWVSSFRGMFA